MLAPSTTTTRLPRRSTSPLRRLLALLLFALPPIGHAAQRELLQLFVTEPYLELHSGPGRGFPVTQVIPRGDSFDVLFRRTEWYKVRTERGVEGWASEASMLKTTLANGAPFRFERGNREGFRSHDWEFGIMAGDYGGASTIGGFAGFSLTDHLSIELSASQFLGNTYNGYIADLGFNHVFMPEWRFSPFVTLGTGAERVEPKTTLVAPVHKNYQSAYVGFGARYYLARRTFLRAEYRSHTVFTNGDSNEVETEWKIGFAFFY
jgi:SH3 domain-containing protein/outer membrane protein with beta-barrel domain